MLTSVGLSIILMCIFLITLIRLYYHAHRCFLSLYLIMHIYDSYHVHQSILLISCSPVYHVILISVYHIIPIRASYVLINELFILFSVSYIHQYSLPISCSTVHSIIHITLFIIRTFQCIFSPTCLDTLQQTHAHISLSNKRKENNLVVGAHSLERVDSTKWTAGIIKFSKQKRKKNNKQTKTPLLYKTNQRR